MLAKQHPELTAEVARELLDYDPDNGTLRWKSSRRRGRAGEVAGCICGNGRKKYIKVRVKRLYRAHILIWLIVTGEWPKSQVDHIDTDGTNNRWLNLRLATPSQNQHNQGIRKTNTTGYKGVSASANCGNPFRANITVNGKRIHLGYFQDGEEAARAYDAAARHHHGEFARLNFPDNDKLSPAKEVA